MKAYLVLDLSVNDYGGFKIHRRNPCLHRQHSGKYIVQGVQPTTIEGDWKPERWSSSSFRNAQTPRPFCAIPKSRSFKIRHATTTSKLVLADGCT